MKLQELLILLFEIEQKTNSIVAMTVSDELLNEEGYMKLLPEGGAFKIYIKSDIDGKKDFIISFDSERIEEYQNKYKNVKIVTIDELESNRIKILHIQDFMTLQSIMEVNKFLEV